MTGKSFAIVVNIRTKQVLKVVESHYRAGKKEKTLRRSFIKKVKGLCRECLREKREHEVVVSLSQNNKALRDDYPEFSGWDTATWEILAG